VAGPQQSQLSALADTLNGAPAVQRLARMGDTLNHRPNRTGLPNRLKAGVEALSGVSLDDVRVHRNSAKPAQLQAHAYTQGSTIHVAPGQERHLPHEAWHVVQQKQGRVRPTTQLAGIGVNDDTALEREADVMGARAVSAGHARPDTATLAPAVSSAVAQRAIGFEFESSNAIAKTDAPAENIAKERVYNGDGFHIDADTKNANGNNIEFVGDPRDTVEEAEEQIEAMAEFAGTLADGAVGGGGWADDYTLTISDPTWDATMQHTEGVLLVEMADFLRFSLDNAEDASHRPAMAGIDGRHQGLPLDAKVKGFIHLVLHYLRTLKKWDGKNNEEGPKNAGPIMSRTDFHAIFQSLDEAQQAQFRDRIGTELAEGEFAVGDPVIPKRYLQYGAGEQPVLARNDTTIGEWLTSIYGGYQRQDGEQVAKDRLSPPDGYDVFENPSYSMGAMAMDGDRVVIEVRNHGNSTNLPRDRWFEAPGLVARGDG
jgi:hypothetical protein